MLELPWENLHLLVTQRIGERGNSFLGLLCWKNPCNEVQTMLVKLVYVPCLDASGCCVYFKFQHRYLHKYQHRSSPVQH